jgi:preprotein translocase subunit SecG
MKTLLLVIQILVAMSLTGVILVQSSKGGLGSAFGGGGEFRSKRGAEKIIFKMTIILTLVFFIVSIINLIVK